MKSKNEAAQETINRLEEDPDSVSVDECFACLENLFDIPEETLRERYRRIKEGLPLDHIVED